MALTRREVVSAMRLRDRETARIADAFYRAKAREYRETLLGLSRRYGEQRKAVVLSPEIREALRVEARDHARLVVRTTNKAIAAEAKRSDLPPYLLARHLRKFVRERGKRRASLTARHEVASARLDAQVSFYRENGLEPLFDFAGPRARCRLCTRLKRGGPWPIDVVVSIGVPHIGCVHSWRARSRAVAALRSGGLRPGRISAGRGGVAGIVGGDVLANRYGTTDEALRFLDRVEAAA